ncbi:MAG: glycine reductase complex protein large subunit [Dehalococcoidia bacterium]|nr:glycine reductase complex protein large subunit [Dehalococcoidia bacterium]
MELPVVRDVRFFLAHTPGLVRHGYKPTLDVARDQALWSKAQAYLRPYADAVAYAPHQVLLGNRTPDSLTDLPQPWYNHPYSNSSRRGPHGELMSEEELYGLLRASDGFDFIWLEDGFAAEAQGLLERHPLVSRKDLQQIVGVPFSRIEEKLADGTGALPLTLRDGRVIGLIRRRLQDDSSLAADILLENLAAKATATAALRAVLEGSGTNPEGVQYVIGSGEEAVGDRYNRGGGNLAKAIAEAAGCVDATGCDVKSFCCAPVHAMIIAGSLIASGVYESVAVVGGGSLAKLGMKFRGHLAKEMPILEDVLVGFAILMGRDDGRSPVLRLDSIGRHTVGVGSAQQQIMEALVSKPLDQVGLHFRDMGKYATEMHNPDITETVGTGNVPLTNYRVIAALAAQRGEIASTAEARDRFVAEHGMPGFSPTQGHVASAIPYLGHALDSLRTREYQHAMFLAKGSLFLGRMTQLSDGVSFILEANPGQA